MPYTKTDLESKFELSDFDVVETLKACGLSPRRAKYTDLDIDSNFVVIRGYFDQGLATDYSVAAELFKQHTGGEPEADSEVKLLDISELLTLASEQTGTRISLTEAILILETCGLPDQEQYTHQECERFLEACDLFKNQGKTSEQVAAHFGAESEATNTDIETDIDEAAAALDESGFGVVSSVMRHKAKADASVAASLYLKHLANEFGSPEFQQAWNHMEEMLKAKVVGKSRMRSRQILGEIRAIPPSPSPLNALPATSDNGSTTD